MWAIAKKILNKFFKKNFIIGLDIGSSSIKMAQFVKSDRNLRIVRGAIKEILGDPVSALKEVLKEVNVHQSQFHVSVNCPLTMVRAEVFPIMPRSELRDAIRFESKNYFPFALEDAFWDFEIVGDVLEQGLEKTKVIIAASPKKTVENSLSLLAGFGIQPSILLPAPLAFACVPPKY